ncbi:MAG: hypothetical protein WBX25_17790 [Rhodomicrobium sp.]
MPAFANVFNVTLNPHTTRIAFGEFVVGYPKEDGRFRHAIVMPTVDAIELAKLIPSLAKQNEEPPGPARQTTIQ